MKEIFERLFIGQDSECFKEREGWVTVHACKYPCHRNAVGYWRKIAPTHPNYLVLENENNLYLNLIDCPKPLFRKESFDAFIEFARKKYQEEKKLFIHCNRCESRAPSLALLFMAKVVKKINCNSYQNACKEFKKIFSGYNPGMGIKTYLTENWNVLN
jgi:hypothetical protein